MSAHICECDLCQRERAWQEEHDTCYRCINGIPCQRAHDSGAPCVTILDKILVSLDE